MHYIGIIVYLFLNLIDLQIFKYSKTIFVFPWTLHPYPNSISTPTQSKVFTFIILKTWISHRYFSVLWLHQCHISFSTFIYATQTDCKANSFKEWVGQIVLLLLPWNDLVLSCGFQHPFFVTFLLLLFLCAFHFWDCISLIVPHKVKKASLFFQSFLKGLEFHSRQL